MSKYFRIEPHYLPSLEFFCALREPEVIELECAEYFVKQTYRNRCRILGANGVMTLTVPLDARRNKTLYRDIRIDYRQPWQNQHWRSLESAYRNAPFFEYYSADLHRELFARHVFLADLNTSLLTLCLRWLRMPATVRLTESFDIHPPEPVIDLRGMIDAKTDAKSRPFYHPVPYYQVFGKAFAENLSLVDLLFCEGPQSAHILEQCRRSPAEPIQQGQR